MRASRRYLGLAVLPLAFAFPQQRGRAQSLDDVRRVVPTLMRAHDVPGLALAVVRGDSMIVIAGFGVARVADSAKVDPQRTLFRIASVAKLFVATAVTQLAQQGTLDLHADIRRYVSEVPLSDSEPAITLHHLLTHTAGLDERLIGYAAHHPDSMVPLGEYLALNLPPRGWPPGLVTAYSNHGMALAAYVAERAVGIPFHQHARERLFIPLGMTRTQYRVFPDSLESVRAHAHFCGDGECSRAPELYSHAYPVGLAYSTAEDMARFLRAQLNAGAVDGRQILSAAAIAMLQAQQFTHDRSLPGMSYGFFNQVNRGWRVLSHAGQVPGMNSLLLLVPEARLGVFFATNGGRSRFGEALRDSLLEWFLPRSANDGTSAVASTRAVTIRDVDGTYQLTRFAHRTIERFPLLFAASVTIRVEDNGHFTVPYPNAAIEFAPLDSMRFRQIDGERLIVFRRDSAGRVTHMFASVPAFGAEMPGAFERRAWHDAPRFMNEYVSWLLAAPLVVLFGLWPLAVGTAWFMRRRRGAASVGPRSRRGFVAWGSAALLYALFASFGFGFIARSVRMFEGSSGIVFGMTPEMRALLVLPYAIAALGAAVLTFAVLAWRRKYWGVVRRVYYSLLAIAAVLIVAFLARWNYLPATW